ncbi:MAG: hypothetical protein OXE99_07645 [Cellvibrionales bacterium]|nr:hypothetical protein [Cellvibrionales bacterium]
MNLPDIDDFLGNLSWEQFFKHHWAQLPLHQTARNGLIEGLNHNDLLRYFSHPSGYKLDNIRAGKGENTQGKAQEDIITVTNAIQARGLLHQGYSLIHHQLQDHLPADHPLTLWLYQLANQLHCPSHKAQLALFVSPAEAMAFAPHIDDNEVFTLQLSGSKDWSLFTIEPHFNVGDPLACPQQIITLHAGDLLYVPRNMIHCVKGANEQSLSIAFIFDCPTLKDAIKNHIQQTLERHTALFQQSLTPQQTLTDEMHSQLMEAISGFDSTEYLTKQLHQMAIQTPINITNSMHETITAETSYKKVSTPWHIETTQDSAWLNAPGINQLKLPVLLAPLLTDMANQKADFSASSIGKHYNDSDKLRIIKHLKNIGIID